MKRISLFVGIACLSMFCSAQTSYQQTFDLNADDEFLAITQTSDGGVLAGGYSTGVPFGGIVVKTDAAGSVMWSKTVGGTRITEVVQTTTGMYYAAGESTLSSNTNFYLTKLDGAGNVLWARSYGKTNEPDQLYSMALTPDGGVILSGNADSTAGSGFLPVGYIIKVDSGGNHEWSRYVSGGNGEIFYVTKPVSGGGYLSCGYTGSFGSPVGTEAYAVRWDANGNVLWTSVFGHNNRFDRIYDFVEKPGGGFFVTGKGLYTSTTDNLWLASLDNAGAVIWHHNYSMYDGGQKLLYLANGNLAMVGYNIDLNLGIYNQSYLIRTDTLGNVQDARQFGAGGLVDDKIWAADETADSGFLLAGSTYGTGVQRTSWIVRTDSTLSSTCRDSALNVSQTTLTIASTSGGTAYAVNYFSTMTVGQLNANMAMQFFCGGPNAVAETAHAVSKAYPVPVSDVLFLEADPAVYSFFTIFNAAGVRVVDQPVAGATTAVDVSAWSKGIYLVVLTGDHERETFTLIVQ